MPIFPKHFEKNSIEFSHIEEKFHWSIFQEDEQLFQFHISNLEYACGACLSQVSALKWDQNESYPQFSGDHTMMTEGYAAILNRLAEEIPVRYDSVVSAMVLILILPASQKTFVASQSAILVHQIVL